MTLIANFFDHTNGIINGFEVVILEVSLTSDGRPNELITLAARIELATFEKWKAPNMPKLSMTILFNVYGFCKPCEIELVSMLKLIMRFCRLVSRFSFSCFVIMSFMNSYP
jgi:hypothetical protein